MANTNAPFGFLPSRRIGGTGGAFNVRRYALATANTAMGIGDPVVMASTGLVNRGAATPAAGTLLGFAAEPKAASAGASSDPNVNTIAVWDDPTIVFKAQDKTGDTVCIVQACIGSTVNYFVANAVNGISQCVIDGATGDVTTGTFPLKIVGLYPQVGNSFGDANILEVVINASAFKADTISGV